MFMTGWGTLAAIPAFARIEKMFCSSCHTAFPKLNIMGRLYKTNGYRYERFTLDKIMRGKKKEGQQLGKDGKTAIYTHLPLALVLKLRPYTKAKSDPHSKITAIEQLRVFAGGTFSEDYSYWLKLSSESQNNFRVSVGALQVGYHKSQALNISIGNRTIFMADPWQNIGNMGALTREGRGIFGSGHHGGSDSLGGSKQGVFIYGLPKGSRFYYAAGVSADSNDDAGSGPKDHSGRIAYSLNDELTMGAFFSSGSEVINGADSDFTRRGFDFHYEIENTTILGAFLESKQLDGRTGYYLEGMFTPDSDEVGPHLVPVLRYDDYEIGQGQDYQAFTMHISRYVRENARIFLEYWKQTEVPVGKLENNRLTLQFQFGF